MKLLYLLAIAAARKTLDIQSPCVVLDESTQWSLADARTRGVRVRILMEGDITDAKPVKFAAAPTTSACSSCGRRKFNGMSGARARCTSADARSSGAISAKCSRAVSETS